MRLLCACFIGLLVWLLPLDAQRDYFLEYRGQLPAKVFYGTKPQNVSLLGVDGKKGIIYAKMEGVGNMQFELRSLKQQNISRFELMLPKDVRTALRYLSNEQYSPKYLEIIRPFIYKVLLYLEIPFEYLPVHDDCLTYAKALVEMELFEEAFYLLSRLNLVKLDEFGYREFSETSLDLAGKMIAKTPKSAKVARALLQKVTIRDDAADHGAYLRLADSLRLQGLYSEAISEYMRLGPIVDVSANSPYKMILQLWPVYCYIKLYETYSKGAAKDERYAAAAGKMFNLALQNMKKVEESPPDRQSNEFSLYKLIRALIRVQYARQFEAGGNDLKAKDFYRQSVLEVTEGIVNARVGLTWLPESLMMAGDAYENLELNEAARNVYKQVNVFFKSTKWASMSEEKLMRLPGS